MASPVYPKHSRFLKPLSICDRGVFSGDERNLVLDLAKGPVPENVLGFRKLQITLPICDERIFEVIFHLLNS
jgi:hypothetical protein